MCTTVFTFAETIEGVWEKDDKAAKIKVVVKNGVLSAKIISTNRSSTYDSHNPNPQLRQRKIIGLQIVNGFTKEGDKWSGGSVYDSRSGKTYQGKLWLEDKNTLKMRAFKGVSLLGKSATWTRSK